MNAKITVLYEKNGDSVTEIIHVLLSPLRIYFSVVYIRVYSLDGTANGLCAGSDAEIATATD